MSAAFVVDSSVALAWCFMDEATAETEKLLHRMVGETAAVPSWWFVEIANVLALAEKKKRITPVQVAGFITLVEGFDLEVDDQAAGRALDHLLALCRAHGLTAYDAIYLDLALRQKLPLATLDEPLRKAARAAGVSVLGR